MTSNAPLPEAPRIAVFARAPVAGSVKTRLLPLLGEEGAARLHAGLVTHALGVAREAGPAHFELWCAPDTKHPFFARCAAGFGCTLRAQPQGDLGERMAHAFEMSAPLVLIGSDCPALHARHLLQAWNALRDHDAAIAPAEDGGYVLIALARPAVSLFAGIEWGAASVMALTRERVAAAGLKCAELETLWDVDRPQDYRRLQRTGMPAQAWA